MTTAADRLFDALDRLAEIGRPPLLEFLGEDPFEEWRHYPQDDFFDPQSGVLVFYHAHSPGDRATIENGHFHCFVERRRVARGAKALIRGARGERALCHVAGLSIDREGVPREIFATSQPVTGEWFYPADRVAPLLPAFAAVAPDAPPAVQWLAAIITLFEPEVVDLLHARDAHLRQTSAGFEAQADAPEILAARPIDIDARLEALGKL